jgi:hypothetical protein
MSIVGVRDVTNSVVSGYGYEITPVAQGAKTLVQVMGDPEKFLEMDEPAAKKAVMATGYMLGLPSRQLWTMIDNFKALSEGEDLTVPEMLMLREQRE